MFRHHILASPVKGKQLAYLHEGLRSGIALESRDLKSVLLLDL